MRKLALGLAWLLLLAAPGGSATLAAEPKAAVRQVILVQNSGWMQPLYQDPRSRFRILVTSLAAQSNLQGVDLIVATFNQDGQVAGERSPQVLWQGPYDAGAVKAAAARLSLPRKASGAYADADFNGALKGTISRLLNGGEGVIWMITNNKDSPDNSQDVVANTERFYGLLRGSPYITRIVAFPIRNDLVGDNFRERGFIVYAFAYGPRAAKALDVILADGAPTRALFRSPPVKLKPLDQNPVELRLAAAPAKGPAVKVVDGALNLSRVPGGKPSTIVFQGVLRNTYYPQNIDRAALTVSWTSDDPDLAGAKVTMSPTMISKVPAGGVSTPITLTLELPAAPRHGPLFGIFETERQVTGVLGIHLNDIEFSLVPEFIERIGAISGADQIRQAQAEAMVSAQLPAVFLDYKRVTDATTKVPVSVGIKYSPLPLILTLSGLALLVLGGAFAVLWGARPRTYQVTVGTAAQNISIRPMETRIISDGFGARARVTGSMFGPPSITSVGDDAKKTG